jgi:hypothetical protein
VALLCAGGLTVIPGSTFGGVIVPFCWDSRLLKVPSGGAIFSGGGEAELGGASGTVGFVGEVGCGFCAIAGTAARIRAVIEKARNILGVSSALHRDARCRCSPNASTHVTFLVCQWNATCCAGSANEVGDCLLRYDKKPVDVLWLLTYTRRWVTSPHRDAFLL